MCVSLGKGNERRVWERTTAPTASCSKKHVPSASVHDTLFSQSQNAGIAQPGHLLPWPQSEKQGTDNLFLKEGCSKGRVNYCFQGSADKTITSLGPAIYKSRKGVITLNGLTELTEMKGHSPLVLPSAGSFISLGDLWQAGICQATNRLIDWSRHKNDLTYEIPALLLLERCV